MYIAPHTAPAVRAIVTNARRFASDALSVAVALDIVAPVAGRTWIPVCCACLDRIEHDLDDALVHYISNDRASLNGCNMCPTVGPDVLVAALVCE